MLKINQNYEIISIFWDNRREKKKKCKCLFNYLYLPTTSKVYHNVLCFNVVWLDEFKLAG